MTARQGKGDKERIAAIADITDETIQSLYARPTDATARRARIGF